MFGDDGVYDAIEDRERYKTLIRQKWHKMSICQMADAIIAMQDAARIDSQGGYPSDYVCLGNKIIIASIDHDGRPELTMMGVGKFVHDNEFWITD